MVSSKVNWSEKEDRILAYKVIQYNQSEKTQVEAFKDAAKEMNRTPAAYGYRSNAKLRNDFQEELKQARQGEVSDSIRSQLTNKYEKIESPLQIA